MTRNEEVPPDNAGTRLLVAIRELGFNNQCLVFTMNEKSAWEKISPLIGPSKRQNIIVTDKLLVLEHFINFIR